MFYNIESLDFIILCGNSRSFDCISMFYWYSPLSLGCIWVAFMAGNPPRGMVGGMVLGPAF